MQDALFAESAIRQLHARYIDAVWRQDLAAFADCFTSRGSWQISGQHAQGRAQIGDLFGRFIAVSERVLMLTGLPILTIGANASTGRLNVTEYIKRKDGSALRTIGVYYDRYALEADQWLFASRKFEIHYRGAPDLSDAIIDHPDPGPHPAAQ